MDVSNNKLIHLKDLSHLKHMIKLKAAWNQIRKTFDFDPPANLEFVDYTGNLINKIENADKNPYLKTLILDSNNIQQIEGLSTNKCLRVGYYLLMFYRSSLLTVTRLTLLRTWTVSTLKSSSCSKIVSES